MRCGVWRAGRAGLACGGDCGGGASTGETASLWVLGAAAGDAGGAPAAGDPRPATSPLTRRDVRRSDEKVFVGVATARSSVSHFVRSAATYLRCDVDDGAQPMATNKRRDGLERAGSRYGLTPAGARQPRSFLSSLVSGWPIRRFQCDAPAA